MSRIADAHARAGFKLPGEDAMRWDAERAVAAGHLGVLAEAKSNAPGPKPQGPSPKSHETIDFEFAAAIRRIFLSPNSHVRSVLFCTIPGDRMTDVAWHAAETLAAQSGQRVAYADDGRLKAAVVDDGHPLITRIGWDESKTRQPGTSSAVPGKRVVDLCSSFAFVIVNASAGTTEDLVPLAKDVDAVIVIVSRNQTRMDHARTLTKALRDAKVTLLCAIFTTDAAPPGR